MTNKIGTFVGILVRWCGYILILARLADVQESETGDSDIFYKLAGHGGYGVRKTRGNSAQASWCSHDRYALI
jgi:hypothetical protein